MDVIQGDCPDFRGEESVAAPMGLTAAKMGLSPLRCEQLLYTGG